MLGILSHLAVIQVPMPFVVQKVGTSSLSFASGSCPPELNLQLSLQLLTETPALMHVHSIFCPRTRQESFQHLLWIKAISVSCHFITLVPMFLHCCTHLEADWHCNCVVCNLSLIACTGLLDTFQLFPSAINSEAYWSYLRMSEMRLVIFDPVGFFSLDLYEFS